MHARSGVLSGTRRSGGTRCPRNGAAAPLGMATLRASPPGRAAGPSLQVLREHMCFRAARFAPGGGALPGGRAFLSGGHVSRAVPCLWRPLLRCAWECARAPWRRTRPRRVSSFGGRRSARLSGAGSRRFCVVRLALPSAGPVRWGSGRRWSRRLAFPLFGASLLPSAPRAEPTKGGFRPGCSRSSRRQVRQDASQL